MTYKWLEKTEIEAGVGLQKKNQFRETTNLKVENMSIDFFFKARKKIHGF